MADGSLPIVVTPEAFGRDAFDLTVVEGLTVRAMLVEAVRSGLPVEALSRTEIYVDGARLDRETALDHVLTAEQVVNVVVEPMGGGGGRKDIGQILLTVAVIAVSAWVGGGAATPAGFFDKLLVRTAMAGAVGLAGQALIGALYGPNGGPAKANDRYALQSASNQYRQWGPMPLALGEVVTAPDLAAKTFTQSQGDDVWMYGILGLHYGPCEVSEVKIGDTLVSTMGAGDFRMVQHLEPGPRTFQLYPNDVDQLDLNEELKATPSSATPLIRAASSDGSRFDIDFFLPGGLHFQKDDGRLLTAHASVSVRYRPIDQNGAATGPWQAAPSWARTSATKDPLRVTHPVHLPHGRYEFELIRNRPDDDNDKRRDTIMVSAIKSVAFRKPVADETLSIIEFAVRATAVNQGGLAPITCRIVPKCPTWTGSAWGPAVATSNPAAVARWLMTGPAPAKPLLPAQADARLRVWHQLCDQYDWTCHYYLTEAGRTQTEALGIVERAGRAGLFWDGTQLAASPWVEKPIPAQVFTDSNLKDHRWEIVYSDPVHALRVEFQNIEKGGEPDELFVYADGYGETADPAGGIKAASLVEALRLDGQATPNRAYRDGRWALGQRKHQRRIDTWTADVEHLVSQYGSRVRLAWNRTSGGSARVRCRRWNEDRTAVVGLRLSAPVEMVAGVSYAVDLRTAGGLYDGVPIQSQPGVTREILFASPRSPGVCPSAGDLIAFGEMERVSEDVELIAIEPGDNLTAVLMGVRYVAPLLMAGETGPIPPLSSRLSGDRQANPPRPTLLGVAADAHAVRVSFDLPTWRGSPLSGFTVRWRARGEGADIGSWAPLPALDAAARQLIAPPLREAPIEGVEATRVEIEITATTVDGRASKPLQVTVVKPVPAAPTASVWSVEAKGPDANGVSQPILIVRGEIADPNVAAVRIAWGLTVDGPWTEVYEGAPLTKALEIGNLTPGVEHFVAITHLSAQGVPSQFLIIGPRVPGQLIAGDTTHLSGEPVQDILDRLTDTATLADQTSAEVQSIRDMYGDTADAATSALKAAAHEAAANQSKAEAILAAEASDQRAEAADAAKLEAQQARAGAVSARNDSVAAAGASGDAAAIAAEERRLAAQARDQAQAEAQAAVGARNQASSFADAAGVGAAASQEASLKATAAVITTIPDAIAADLWTDIGSSGAPPDRPSLAPQRVVNGALVAPVGAIINAGPKQRVRWVQGKVIEIRLRAEVPAGTPAATVRIGVTRFDANHVNLNSNSWMAITAVAADGSKEVVYRIGCGVAVTGGSTINPAPGLEWLSIGCTPNLNAAASASEPGAQMRITAFSVRDTTEEVNAAREANAAATFAASAAASDGAAGQKAAAAHEDMLAAQTARGGAESAETRAVAARDDAEGHASTAASQAGLSAEYRDQSQTAAQASNEAAGIAATKANEAGVNAEAANAAKLEAQAARDTADQKAQASVTAAARAEAFAGEAGDWAAASEGWALQAAASAGEGLAYRNAAVDARDGAVAAKVEAGTLAEAAEDARDIAEAAAATSVTQSSAATAAAAEAKINANLAAKVGGGSLNQNPSFTAWSGALPDGYITLNAANGTYAKEAGRNGLPNAVRTASLGTADFGFAQITDGAEEGGEWVALEVDVTLVSGSFAGSGVAISARTASGPLSTSRYSFFTEFGAGEAGATYRLAKLVDLRHAGAVRYGVNAWARWGQFPPSGAVSIDWHRIAIRPATEAEIASETVLPAVQAQASLALSTSVDALTQLGQAAFELILASGGIPAYIKALAEPGGSEIAFAATKLLLLNVIGDQAVTAMELINGEAYFGAPVSVDIDGRRLTIGPGFGASDSQVVLWFGPNTVALASMSRTNGYFALGTDGKVYYGSAELGGDSSGRKIINFSGRSTSGTSYTLLASGAVTNARAGNIVQADVALSLVTISPVGATTVGGLLQLWEQDAAGKANIGAAVPFLANSETGTFDAKPLLGSATKSGAVTYGVDWRSDSPGTVNVSNSAGQVDITALRSL